MKNSLKILYSEAATSYGGQERYIHRLMRMMRDQGHTVELLCQPQSELSAYLQADGFTVHHAVMDKGTDFWRNLLSLRRLIKQQAYDVVNTHSRRGVTPDYVDVVFPAVDLPDPLPPQQLRHELGLSTNALLIGTVAVLRKEKGVKELIQATAPILLQYPNVYLVVIGGGVLQQQLEQVAQQLNVSNQVFF